MFRIIILISTYLFLSSTVKAAPTDQIPVNQVIKKLGFHPLNAQPTDFLLKDMNDQEVSLENLRGKWTWLVFWATWCGACKQAMPILETLHVGFEDKGLKVLAVSIDEGGKQQVAPYAKENDLTYQMLLDSKNEVASKYQATSIPTIYLISPDLRLAGLARGAVNWETQPMLTQVAKLLEYEGLPQSTEDIGLTLPDNLTPPEIIFTTPETGLKAGQEYKFNIAVKWQGDAHQYLIKVPKLTVPESVSVGQVSSSTNSYDGNSELHYHFPVKVNQPGKVIIGPVELAYQHRQGGNELFTRVGSRELNFVSPHLFSTTQMTGIGGMILCLGAGFWYWRRQRTTSVITETQGLSVAMVEDELQLIKKARISGDQKGYAIQLIELANKINPALQDKSQAMLEQIKFAGFKPADTELKVFEKEVEHYITPIEEV
ncbi:MAG: hypothetical protein CMP10_13790 [Zetaproteobacteria bacterium]|nr:hypothetical protein [Pseudobdellovibrionaceae bacterium]